MISRRKFFIFTSGLIAAPMVDRAGVLMPLRGKVMPPPKLKSQWYPTPYDSYLEFTNTSYLDRMDFSEMGYDVSVTNIQDKFDYINRQVLAFREQEPHVLGPDKRRYRNVVEVNGSVTHHDDHLRDQIRDAIKQSKANGVG